MIGILLVFFLFGMKTLMAYTFLNFLIAIYLKFHIRKYYQPRYQLLDNKVKKNIHDDYPAFNRRDPEPKFLRIFFGLVSFVWVKVLANFLTFFSAFLINKALVKLNLIDDSIKSRAKLRSFYQIIIRISLFINGIVITKRETKSALTDEIYKKYLGQDFDYQQAMESNDFIIYACNHIGWIDAFFMGCHTSSIFVAKASTKNIPIIGYIGQQLNVVFIDRGDKDSKAKSIDIIDNLCDEIADRKRHEKLLLFCEGTATNNSGIIEFKKGAFAKLHPIKPVIMKIDDTPFSLAAGAISLPIHVILSFCYLYHKGFVHYDLPTFTPNEYLFLRYAHLGKDRIEIYSKAVRNVIGEIAELPIYENNTYETKLEYISRIKGRKVKST